MTGKKEVKIRPHRWSDERLANNLINTAHTLREVGLENSALILEAAAYRIDGEEITAALLRKKKQ